MVDIVVTQTAKEKSTRQYKDSYLSSEEIKSCLREGGGTIYRETSPVNENMYSDNEFIWRIHSPMRVDFPVVVENGKIIVKTQMSHHNSEYENSDFYEEIGSTIAEMLNSIDSWV